MKAPPFAADQARLPLILTVALSATVLVLSGYGYWAVKEWRKNTATLIQRTTEDEADRLVIALTRDMRGAQALVLASRDSGDYATQSLADFSYEAASAFTRYLYPESFFGWKQADGELIFFHRTSRTPRWMTGVVNTDRFPVVMTRDPSIARTVFDRIRLSARNRLSYAHFDTELAGVPYQIVARLQYADLYRERLESVTGFTVNLAWVRQRYFSDLVSEVSRIGERSTALDYAVLDDRGQELAGVGGQEHAALREFPLQFFDPAATELDGEEGVPPLWKVRVSAAGDPVLRWATSGEDTTLLAIAATAFALAVSFMLTAHSVRARASLAAMRAEFVSIAAHELKTPLATIRAASETMVRGRLTGAPLTEYSHLLLHESKRLTRLVDNLLAYARIIDVKDLYQFERLAPAELIEDSLSGFERQLDEGGFDVNTDIPHDLPLIRGDRTALRLALDNLIDNAIRYSADIRHVRLSARCAGPQVVIEVCDRGTGIPSDEIQMVKRRFVRGRRTGTHGSGLGLAIVMRVAADHGGAFELDSEIGSGTTARLELPTYGDG